MNKSSNPIASIIIPVLNEKDYLYDCVESVVASTEGIENMEILLIDGGSTDGTREVIKKLIKKHHFIKLLENKRKIIPAALNIGIKNSSGIYIVRLDAHALYDAGYVNKCIETLKNSDEKVANVGGVIETKPSGESLFAKTISYVLSSKLGVGNSTFRVSVPRNKKFVETVPFGCYRKEIFEELGFFNENEHRNEDIEFNKRLISSGKKILLDPEIKSSYFTRKDLTSLFKQQFNNGFIVTNKYRGDKSFHELRHFVPLFFAFYFFFSLIFFGINFFGYSSIYLQPVLISWLAYFFISLGLGLYFTIISRDFLIFLSTPLVLFSLHLSYGIGSLWGLMNITYRRDSLFLSNGSESKDFKSFLSEVFPHDSPFDRTNFGTFTNLVKFFALRVAYLFYKIKISANTLDILSVIITVPGFFMIYKGLQDLNLILFLSGFLVISWILFIDFVDGSLARIHKYKFKIGDDLDNLPPDLVRAGSYIVIGYMTQSVVLFLLSIFNAVILDKFIANTNDSIQENRKFMRTLLGSRMSLTGIRVLSGLILPFLSILYIYNQFIGSLLSKVLIIIYSFLIILWILFVLEDKTLKK